MTETRRVSTSQAAVLLGIGPRRVRQLIKADRIPGAERIGHIWTVPLGEAGNILITTSDRGRRGAAWRMAERITETPDAASVGQGGQ